MSPTTGTTGTIRHPDVAEISDLTEGLLSPARTAAVRGHLDDCALCADVLASLQEIRALLGTLPGPSRMPADIAGRIDAALAAEALLDSTSRHAEPAPAFPGRDVSRETSPSSPARPAGHPAGPTGPGRRRARRRIAVLTGLAGAAACVLGLFLSGGLGGSPQHTVARTGTSATTGPHTSDSLSSQGLQGSVDRLLASGAKPQTKPEERNNTYGMENASPQIAPDERQSSTVPPCVREATGRTDTPLAAEHGTYQGTDVYLVVLPHPDDPARVDAFVVPSGCADVPSAAPGKPMLTGTYARP
ncbi:anti-sigma factor [Streptomyces sp. A1136]|uniref:anti-sigma factor family protein n=1 Tax=Streptomyces sp. A1136 TaxID=2563102 RepID=UPI00109E4750|nr:hypothetical protein [Streptomyces sp. A1136]THA59258.1 hypothetical protein E6R62_01005 [Streptomyces sp. A1136]